MSQEVIKTGTFITNGIIDKRVNGIGNTRVNARNGRVIKSIIPLARHYGLELQLRPNF